MILKATAGGGGKGMRLVWKEEEFEEAMEKASQEAGAAFGNAGMYMEKYILEPRHIEIQIAGDQYGTFCHMSERDCSIQRRHQKLVEETPSPFMTKALRKKMGEAAIKAAASVNYEGVGTVEFLVDKNRNFYFMEMNTRIQVEHTITEEVIDYDLIREQIKIAAGIPISGSTTSRRATASSAGSTRRTRSTISVRHRARSPATTVPVAMVCAWIHTCTRATRSHRTTTA